MQWINVYEYEYKYEYKLTKTILIKLIYIPTYNLADTFTFKIFFWWHFDYNIGSPVNLLPEYKQYRIE